MNTGAKIAIVVLLAAAAAATFALRGSKRAEYVAVPVQPAAVAPAPRPPQPHPPAPAPVQAPKSPPAAPAPARDVATTAAPVPVATPAAATPAPRTAAVAPRLLELGSMRCMACLEMAKVLDALRASQGERLRVDFIDVFEQPDAADRYKITLIPTQILFDAAEKEIFRHTGYFSHDDILAKFRELGVEL